MYEGNFSALILIANLWAVAIGYRDLRSNRKTLIIKHKFR